MGPRIIRSQGSLSGDGAIEGGAADRVLPGQFGGGVLPGVVVGDEVRFLAGAEFGLLAAEAPFGFGDLHAFAGAHTDEVGFDYVDKLPCATSDMV